MNDFTVVTVCTHFPQQDYFMLNEYLRSLQGVPLLLLDTTFHSYTGLGSKPKMLYKAIKENVIKTKLTLFTDCFDFLFTDSPNKFIDTYLNEYKSPLVISSEKNCFPDTLKKEYDALHYTSSYRYLNSGMICGETEALLTCLETMDLKNVPEDYRKEDGSMCHINDQELWQQLFLKQPVKIELDYQQKLCNTLHSVTLDELDFAEEKIKNKETNQYPCSLHFNGNAKTENNLRPTIFKHLKL